MKTDKDAISCIQMIMWYFINPSFCLTTLPRGGRRSDPAAGASAVSMPCSRTHQQGGLAIMSSVSPCGRFHVWICSSNNIGAFFSLFKEIISLNKLCGECKVIPTADGAVSICIVRKESCAWIIWCFASASTLSRCTALCINLYNVN